MVSDLLSEEEVLYEIWLKALQKLVAHYLRHF